LEAGELVTEVRIPKPGAGSRSVYRKYRQRQSIDFPVVSAAVRIDMVGGFVKEARVVLGAAAPIPLQAKAAEVYLIGKSLDQIKALPENQEARPVPALPGSLVASLALQGSAPLAENAYKIQITRAYVRRAILACLETK
jgi:CO/xanthine dehydrogenase FAD-binding subunit